MKESTTKEKVLKKIRDALVNPMSAPFEKVDMEHPVFMASREIFREEQFAEAFTGAGGQFIFCPDVDEFAADLQALITQKGISSLFCGEEFITGLLKELKIPYENDPVKMIDCQATITGCEALVASHGSVVFSSRQGGGRKSFACPPLQIVVATNRQLVADLSSAFRFLNAKYNKILPSQITFATGPSRTADIEKTLVHGAHGPKELYLLMLDIGREQAD